MALLERQPQNGGASDALDLLGYTDHPTLSFRRPVNRLLGLEIKLRRLPAHRQEHVARRQAQQVLGVRADAAVGLLGVHANLADDQQVGLDLARPVEHLLKGLTVKQGLGDLDAGVLGDLLAHIEMRLVDVGETGVDDLLVQLILLFEAKDLGRFVGQHLDDALEDRVVQIGIVDRDQLDLLSQLLGQVDAGGERTERFRAAVDADQDRVALVFTVLGQMLDHPQVAVDRARQTLAHRTDLGVTGTADADRAEHDQIIVGRLDVLDQLGRVFTVHHLGSELETGTLAGLLHILQVTVGNELETHRDQVVVDLALAMQLGLLEVLLGQCELHLLEAIVVHLGSVDVAAGELGAERLAQLDRSRDGAVGVVGVVDGHIDALIHGISG